MKSKFFFIIFYLFIEKKVTKRTGAQALISDQSIRKQSSFWEKQKNKLVVLQKMMESEIINIFRNNLEERDSKIEILQNNLNSGKTTTKKIYK